MGYRTTTGKGQRVSRFVLQNISNSSTSDLHGPESLTSSVSQDCSVDGPLLSPGLRTTQHPHPVPRRERDPVDSFRHGKFYSDGDLRPHTQSDHWMDQGLELLVGVEKLPAGTPGGREADLKRGALIDGAKHEKHGQSTDLEALEKPNLIRNSNPLLLSRHL